jgi:hypothetical protein
VLVPLDVVKYEHDSIAGRQLTNCAFQTDTVGCIHQAMIANGEEISLEIVFIGGLNLDRFSAGIDLGTTYVHERGIHGDAVQPGRKQGIAAKRVQAPKCAQECLLHEIFGNGLIVDHSFADCEYPARVLPVETLKAFAVALHR